MAACQYHIQPNGTGPYGSTLWPGGPHGTDNDSDNGWGGGMSKMWSPGLPSLISYIVASAYLGLLSIVAIIMCFRSRTRLRLYACFSTCLALSISLVGLFWTLWKVYTNYFWLWNFTGESVGMVALTYAIVSVGNGFYPMAGKKNRFWRMAMCWIIVYAVVATANIGLYIQQKLVHHYISPEEIQLLRQTYENNGGDVTRILNQIHIMQCKGLLPTVYNPLVTGVDSYQHLTWIEMQIYERPLNWAYMTHQMLMLFTCMWASFYLFIPLVRHHRHGPVGRPVDSDMMAVGVWYLGCLLTLTLAYAVLNIYFCVRTEYIYLPQAQALDLCIRATIGPIFFLPAPSSLIRFYRQRFKGFVKGSSIGGASRRGGIRQRFDGSGGGAGCQGSLRTGDDFSSPCSPDGSRLGRPDGDGSYSRASFDDVTSLKTCNGAGDSNNNSLRQTSIGSTYGRLRLFHSRDRGASMESNKFFNQDFEQEELPQNGHHTLQDPTRLDPFDQYYNHMGTAASSDIARGTAVHQISSLHITNPSTDPLAGLRPASMEPQKPERALTADGANQMNHSWKPGRFMKRHQDDVFAPVSAAHSKEGFDSAFAEKIELAEKLNHPSSEQLQATHETKDITGTTGWEIGGWGHIRHTSEGNENSLSSPMEPCLQVTPSQALPLPPAVNPAPSGDEIKGPDTILDVHDVIVDQYLDHYEIPSQELTGLQKQLAEYRSALLPLVLAMHDMDDGGPPSVTFDSRDDYHRSSPDHGSGGGDNSFRALRTRGPSRRHEVVATGGSRPSYENDPSTLQYYSATEDREGANNEDRIDEANEPAEIELPGAVHSVDPLHWAKLPANPPSKPTFGGAKEDYAESVRSQNGLRTGSSGGKSSDNPVLGFRKKWLASRKANESDRPGPPKKFEMDPPPVVLKASGDDTSKASKRNSNLIVGIENTQAAKGSKPKEGRRNVFSKLSAGVHKGGERGRPSQDMSMSEQGKDYKPLDGESKSPCVFPATVEALALETTMNNLEDDDEDKGLQYYYPDPYYSVAEFKRSQAQAALRASASGTSSQRHPLSPTFSDDGMGSKAQTAFLSKSSSSASPLVYHSEVTFDKLSLALALEDSISGSSVNSPSFKTTKSSASSKKSSKKDPVSSPALSMATPNSTQTSTVALTLSSSPLGSLLSRSASNSKKLGSKIKARGARSKSDAEPSRSSTGLPSQQRDISGAMNTVVTATDLPITTTRKSGIPTVPAISQPAQKSLSPPPRQSWARSRSFQGTTPALTVAMGLINPGATIMKELMLIDTKLANEGGAAMRASAATAARAGLGMSGSDAIPSSGGTRSSLSSSLGSPTTGSITPTMSPTSETPSRSSSVAKTDYKILPPSSPPLSPPLTSSYARVGGLKPRSTTTSGRTSTGATQDYRNHSLDQEREALVRGHAISGAASAKGRTGFSTAAMDQRRATSRQQRSVDNLASAYYYRRATELNNNSSGNDTDRDRAQSTNASSLLPPPPSPQLVNSGFSYYGIGVAHTGSEDSGRSSPTLHLYSQTLPQSQYQSQSHPLYRDPLSGNGSGYVPHGYQKSKTSLDYSLPGGGSGHNILPATSPSPISLKPTDETTPPADTSRTSSITNSLRLLADDPWTQAMVARAQSASSGGGGGGSGSGSGTGTPSNVPSQSHHVHSLSYCSPQNQLQYPYPGNFRSQSPSPSPNLGPGNGSSGGGGGGGGSSHGAGAGSGGDYGVNGYGYEGTSTGSSGAGGAYNNNNNYVRTTSPLSPEFYSRPSFNRTGSE